MAIFTEVFDDVTKKGTKIPTNLYLEEGKYPIVDQGQKYIAGYTNDLQGIFDDVPAIVFGDHTRVIKYVDTPFFLGADGVKVLKSKSDKISHKYLYYALCNARIPNTGYNRHFKWLKEIDIPICSRSEQLKIVSNLESIDNVIELHKELFETHNETIRSRFMEMFGDPITNPHNWESCTIGRIATDVRYGTSKPSVEGGKYPYLRMNNLTADGYLDLNGLKYIDIPDNEIEKCIVRKGDVLFNRTNSIELVGKTCVFELNEEMVIAGYIIRVRLCERILPKFFSIFMNTKAIKEQLRAMAKGAVNQANINAQELQSINIYLPPLELQQEFIAFVEQVESAKKAVQKSLDNLEILKKSLMQKYFG